MHQPTAQSSQATEQTGPTPTDASISRIKELLDSKDDTPRFVGLALLKSVLDNSPELRQDEPVIRSLWASVSPKFLDRLIKTGCQTSGENVKEMLDLAVSVMHLFAALLPEADKSEAKFTERIPGLISAALYTSDETTTMLLQLLHALVSNPEGAVAFLHVEDVSTLAEIAPSHALVLDIFLFAWMNGMTATVDKQTVINQVANATQLLVSAFIGTDASTLLDFLGRFLQSADSSILPLEPKWLKSVAGFIHQLATGRPNAAARSAYTNATAALLQAYPSRAPKFLFVDKAGEDKSFAYLLINLMLIDIRSSAPVFLQELNEANYSQTARRLASAFDVVAFFIGYLVRCLEDESIETFPMSPDSLLKLRKGISETMSTTIELLRDRWDATFAGAMGLHPDARAANTETVSGSHKTLAWDAMANSADKDPFTLSAIRALALWLREDDNETLRKEATGLTDMFLELYRNNPSDGLDFRSSVLVALEALITTSQGRELFLSNGGWAILTRDLASLLQQEQPPGRQTDADAARGVEIVRVLLSVAEGESSGTPEEWMDLITSVAAWDFRDGHTSEVVNEFQVAVLQLTCTLLEGAGRGMRNRYRESVSAIRGIASRLCDAQTSGGELLREAMDDVTDTLNSLDMGS